MIEATSSDPMGEFLVDDAVGTPQANWLWSCHQAYPRCHSKCKAYTSAEDVASKPLLV